MLTLVGLTAARLRMALIAFSGLMIALVCTGAFSNGRIGALTWGPTVDFWAMAVAISNIEHGIRGGVGRKEISVELARTLTSKGNDLDVGDVETLQKVSDPQLVDAAIKSAARIRTESLPAATVDSSSFVNVFAEDIGFADFYNIAFRIFGYSAYSTHFLYCSILMLSFAVFLVAHRTSMMALSMLTLATMGLFLATTTVLAPGLVPAPAANRFLATLCIIPMLHFVVAAIEPPASRWAALLGTGLQVLIFSFVLGLRTSAVWSVLALLGVLAVIVLVRTVEIWREVRPGQFISVFFESADVRRACLVIGLAVAGVTAYSSVRDSRLHYVYFGDDLLPHHLRWHSAYLGLTLHPDWPNRNPLGGETGGRMSDTLAWTTFERHMKTYLPNSPITSPIAMQLYRTRLHDRIIGVEFKSFASRNLSYIAQLYLYYKPLNILETLSAMAKVVPRMGWLIVVLGVLLAGIGIANATASRLYVPSVFLMAIGWLASLAPAMWAYAAVHVMSDSFIMTTSFLAFVLAFGLAQLMPAQVKNLN